MTGGIMIRPNNRRLLMADRLAACALALLASCALLTAQNVVLTGALSGRLTDESGAIVAGGSVVVQNLQTGVKQSAETDHAELYRFPVLMPGSYSISATLAGFRDVQGVIQVQVGNTTLQDMKLQVGASKDTVKVVATALLLRPTEASISSVLDQSLIEELPLNGRRYTDFTLLTPNTAPDGDTGLISIAGQQGGEDSGYANGKAPMYSLWMGPTPPATTSPISWAVIASPTCMARTRSRSFKSLSARTRQFMEADSSFINAVTRSGSNAFHGSVFYYNRNSATGTNDSLSNASGFPKQEDALQQFGAGVGGPIVRNRLWFFLDYEQQLENDPISVINPALATVQADLLDNFGIPNGTKLPAPNAPYPVPGNISAPDPNNPVYLQQVSNTLNALNSNLGIQPRKKNDLVFTPRLDYQATSRDSLFLSVNVNRFSSPGGVITVIPVAVYGTQTLADDYVHAFQASLGWTHTFTSKLLNEFHAGTSDDNQIATPTGRAPDTPTIILDSPASFTLGNAPFSVERVFERQYSVSDRVDYVIGKHTLQFGFDWSRAWDADTNFGGADPNADVQFGSFLGSYEFSNLESFALGEYNLFSQASGNPTFSFAVPYYGF